MRLDTRFRDLQRRGNEIAGDTTRRAARKEKAFALLQWSFCLCRPMMEKDASEYLRELEVFHAEQEGRQVRIGSVLHAG